MKDRMPWDETPLESEQKVARIANAAEVIIDNSTGRAMTDVEPFGAEVERELIHRHFPEGDPLIGQTEQDETAFQNAGFFIALAHKFMPR